jgi:hypothetical protein
LQVLCDTRLYLTTMHVVGHYAAEIEDTNKVIRMTSLFFFTLPNRAKSPYWHQHHSRRTANGV